MSRYLNSSEKLFIEMILKNNPEAKALLPYISQCLVEEMNDGGMGSLKFLSTKNNRYLGKSLVTFEFLDDDGITVLATLNLDNYGDFYELDIWKTDFSPLKHLPNLGTCSEDH